MKSLKTFFVTAIVLMIACNAFAFEHITVAFDETTQRMHTVFYSSEPVPYVEMTYTYSGSCGAIEYFNHSTQSYEAGNIFENTQKAWCSASLEPVGLAPGESMTFSATATLRNADLEVIATVGPFEDVLRVKSSPTAEVGDYEYAQGCANLDLPEIIDIGQSYCATLCHGSYTIPVYCESIGYTPELMQITIENGCGIETECNSSACTGLQEFDWNLQSQILVYEFGGECYIFLQLSYCGTDEGCICISRGDFFLNAELSSFDAVAGDSRVTLNWSTASETDNDHFNILRDGEKVAEVVAANIPTGSSYTWADNGVVNGTTYSYTLQASDILGNVTDLRTASVTPTDVTAPASYSLSQNYPNPFNSETTFSFSIPEAQHVTLTVYDVLGRQVATVLDREMSASTHTVNWSADGLAAGVYMYTLTAGDFSKTNKMLYLK